MKNEAFYHKKIAHFWMTSFLLAGSCYLLKSEYNNEHFLNKKIAFGARAYFQISIFWSFLGLLLHASKIKTRTKRLE